MNPHLSPSPAPRARPRPAYRPSAVRPYVRALIRFPSLLLLAAALGGCAAPAPQDPGAASAAHLAWLESLDAWRTSGRVAVDVPRDAWTANLRWRQAGADYSIWLGGPFGQGAVNIDGDAAGVVLRTADGRRVEAATPEALAAAELGVDVPISLLRYWIVGRAAPGPSVTGLALDGEGRLESLEQSGWQVRYEAYSSAGLGSLPSRLELRRGDIRVRLVLSRWQAGA